MPRIIVTAVLASLLPSLLWSQQNLFNIPNGNITPKSEVFYQHQLNFYDSQHFASKQHLVLGIGRGWDVGMNLVGLNLRRPAPNKQFEIYENGTDANRQLKPGLLGTVQKQWQLSPSLCLNLGAQVGGNLAKTTDYTRLLIYNYGMAVWKRGHTRLAGGAYYGNRSFLGGGNNAGILLGGETPITKRLLLMGDWIVGTNDESVGVLGFAWLASPHVQFCLGGMLGSPGSANKPGIVFELNLLTWRDWPLDAQH